MRRAGLRFADDAKLFVHLPCEQRFRNVKSVRCSVRIRKVEFERFEAAEVLEASLLITKFVARQNE